MIKNMREKHRKIYRVMEILPFLLYLIVMSYFLFFSESFGRTAGTEGYHYNLKLFNEITRYVEYHSEIGWKSVFINLCGNVMVMIPFGFFLSMHNKRRTGLLFAVCATFLLSLAIELIQLIFCVGIFDVDDIFLNTLGGSIGFLVFQVTRSVSAGLIHSGKTQDPANVS